MTAKLATKLSSQQQVVVNLKDSVQSNCLAAMNFRSRIPERVKRIRYYDEGGGSWDPLEVQIPAIGGPYEGCTGVIVCYPLSKTDRLHSTVLVGKKCKGGIWSKEITIGNKDETVMVEGWSVRHIKAAEVRQSVEEKRTALKEVICCGNPCNGYEELEKSFLIDEVQGLDYYHEDIHAFKLCFELFIKEPDGTITLWDRITTNLCTEEKPTKARNHTDVQTIPRIPAKHPKLPINLGCNTEKQMNGAIQSQRLLQPDDTELVFSYDFQDLGNSGPVENNVPSECWQNTISGAQQAVVQEYDEPMEFDFMQPVYADDGNDQNFEVILLERQNPAEFHDLQSSYYPEQLLKASVSGDGLSSPALFADALEPAQQISYYQEQLLETAVSGDGLSSPALYTDDLEQVPRLDGCPLIFLDYFEDYIRRNTVEDINYEIQKREEILHIETPTPNYEPVIDDGIEPGFISLPMEDSGAHMKWRGFPPGQNICDAPDYTEGYQTQTWEKEFTADWPGADLFQLFPDLRSSDDLWFY